MADLYPDLVEDLARRRVVVFLGAGVTAGSKTKSGKRIKLWEDFLQFVCKKVGEKKSREYISGRIKEKDYLMASELIRESLGKDAWEKELQKEFAQKATPSNLHNAIISLDQRIIITTNFDKLVETAWNNRNSSHTHYPQTIHSLDESVFKILRDNLDYIVKIHGSIDEPKSIIFSKADYSEKAFGNWAYVKFIEALLLTHTFLFIGFSMNDPAIGSIVETYAHHLPNARPHYILLPGDFPEQYIQISKKLRRLFIIKYDPSNNHAQAIDIVNSLARQSKDKRKILLSESASKSARGPAKSTKSVAVTRKKSKKRNSRRGARATPARKRRVIK